MADNTTLNLGSGGDVISTDDLGTVKVQRVKVQYGSDGVAQDVDATHGLPVTGTFWQATQPVSIAATVTVDTELPAAAALADAASNPTTPPIGAYLCTFNGTTWDRARGSTANGLVVDVSRVQGTVTTTVSSGSITADTELPAAAALADGASNPTAPAVGAFLSGYNGTTWDRLHSSTANGLVVDVSRVQGTVTISGTVTANIGTSGTLALDATLTGGSQQTKLTDGSNVASIKAASTAAVATDKALVVAVSPNNTVAVSGTFWQSVQPVSQSGTWTVQPGNTANTTPWLAKIGDGTNTMAIKAASTAPVATDPAAVVTLSPNSPSCGTQASGTLGALNAAVTCSLNGMPGAGWFIPSSSTLVGTVKGQYTYDGSNWIDADVSQVTASGTSYNGFIAAPPGATQVRLTVTAYTSGSATGTVNATDCPAPTVNKRRQLWKSFAVTTTQTGTVVWAPTSGNRVVITHYELASGGTQAAKVTLFFAPSGTTTYTEGTTQPLGKFEFTPTANATPGAVVSLPTPICGAVNDNLHLTTSAGITLDGVFYGYEEVG